MNKPNFLGDVQQFLNNYQLWIGIVLGWFLTRFMEVLIKPNVSFHLSDDREFTKANRQYKFINLIVSNDKRNFLKKFLFGNSPINNARVWLRFKDYSSKIEFLKIDARWSSTKEPVDNTDRVIFSEIIMPSRDTIPAGEQAAISVAIKEFGEDSFFAFNNQSYLHNWKNPDYELDEKKYWLEVRLLADGNEYLHEFLLTNPSKALRNFKLVN